MVHGLETALAGRLRFVFRNFPLMDIHPHALQAAEAAEAADAQGRFWDMLERLFKNQKALERGDLLRYATGLKLDADRFLVDLETHAHAARIQGDLDSGDESDVQGTPTLFVNEHRHEGGYNPDSLLAALRAAGA